MLPSISVLSSTQKHYKAYKGKGNFVLRLSYGQKRPVGVAGLFYDPVGEGMLKPKRSRLQLAFCCIPNCLRINLTQLEIRQKAISLMRNDLFVLSGWQDSNLRPPAPKADFNSNPSFSDFVLFCHYRLTINLLQI